MRTPFYFTTTSCTVYCSILRFIVPCTLYLQHQGPSGLGVCVAKCSHRPNHKHKLTRSCVGCTPCLPRPDSSFPRRRSWRRKCPCPSIVFHCACESHQAQTFQISVFSCLVSLSFLSQHRVICTQNDSIMCCSCIVRTLTPYVAPPPGLRVHQRGR